MKVNQSYEGSEDAFQCTAMQYIRVCYPEVLAFHVANERRTSIQAGAMLKRKGVLAGVPDILIIKEAGLFIGFVIELKVKKGRLSTAQKERLEQFRAEGWKTLVTWSLDEFIEEVDDYLS